MLGVLNSIELKPQEEEEDNDEVQIPPQAYEQLSLFSDLSFQNFFPLNYRAQKSSKKT